MYSPSIEKLIACLKKLPSVGEHTAERYVFHWLKSGKKEVSELALALNNLITNTQSCKICWNFSDNSPCEICSNPKRNRAFLCVVSEPQDLSALEKTDSFNGVYHVLRGLLDTENLDTLHTSKIKELLARCKPEKKLSEILLALNPSMEGETTSLYLEQQIKKLNPKLKITRLARGLPLGSDIRYADEMTLESAVKNRTIK